MRRRERMVKMPPIDGSMCRTEVAEVEKCMMPECREWTVAVLSYVVFFAWAFVGILTLHLHFILADCNEWANTIITCVYHLNQIQSPACFHPGRTGVNAVSHVDGGSEHGRGCWSLILQSALKSWSRQRSACCLSVVSALLLLLLFLGRYQVQLTLSHLKPAKHKRASKRSLFALTEQDYMRKVETNYLKVIQKARVHLPK